MTIRISVSEEFLNKVSTSLIEVANAYEDGQMGVWDTFIATFWANIAALAIFAIPGLAVWAFFRDRNNRIRRWWHRFKRNVSLKVRFGWLVLRGKREKRPSTDLGLDLSVSGCIS